MHALPTQTRTKEPTRPPDSSAAPRRRRERPEPNATWHALATRPPGIQAKLTVGAPDDEYEREADEVADQVVQRSAAPQVQRLCTGCEEELVQPQLRTGAPAAGVPSPAFQAGLGAGKGGGASLPEAVRGSIGGALGADFSGVRVHTDERASTLSRSISARAFTHGSDIYFERGEYQPESARGKHLLAHELTHVVQQGGSSASHRIQRAAGCSDPAFCTPFSSHAHAASAEAMLRFGFLPAMSAKFGTEVHDLWESFLSRTSSSSLTPRIFDTAGDPIEESFASSWDTESDEDDVLDMVIARVRSFPGGRLRPHSHTVSSLSNYLSASEMDDRPINYSNPLSKAGNIAGGIGSSAAGPDSRRITRANVVMTKRPLIGDSGWIDYELVPHYEVIDAVDLCPGQCGSPAEQIFTIPLSMLEASGLAFDVPYIVQFTPDRVTNTEFYSTFPI